jgi:predicted polyphosphate/ATP-dependent NAD kinase
MNAPEQKALDWLADNVRKPSGPLKVIACGGRDYADAARVDRILSTIHEALQMDDLIHGGASGADTLAASWAMRAGVRVREYQADWATLGRAAGPSRNAAMLMACPALVVAFPGGRGTADMVAQAGKARVPVWAVRARLEVWTPTDATPEEEERRQRLARAMIAGTAAAAKPKRWGR